jgi:biotin transport system substrate-specific component
VGGSVLMALCAHVSIPLWFTPVPITLQTFGISLLALTLGGWRASAALCLYLLEGAAGLPVFNPHGLGGIVQLLGPTGGYLMAYPIAALASGLIAQKVLQRARLLSFSLAVLVSDVIIFSFGALWLSAITHQPAAAILTVAVLPFLPGEVIKASAAIALAMGKKFRYIQA